MFSKIRPTPIEITTSLPGDNILPSADLVMDRAFDLPTSKAQVWPWIAQLGKNRAGWYFPKSIELFIPRGRRALRTINPKLQGYKVGDRIDDWGGKDGYLEIAELDPPNLVVFKSTRGKISMSWVICLSGNGKDTRVAIRLRLTSSGRKRFIRLGELFDKLTILGLGAGLRERLAYLADGADSH